MDSDFYNVHKFRAVKPMHSYISILIALSWIGLFFGVFIAFLIGKMGGDIISAVFGINTFSTLFSSFSKLITIVGIGSSLFYGAFQLFLLYAIREFMKTMVYIEKNTEETNLLFNRLNDAIEKMATLPTSSSQS